MTSSPKQRSTGFLILAAAVAAAGCGSGSGSHAPKPDQQRAVAPTRPKPTLASEVLRASQVGPGYRLRQRPDGHGARGYVTLDLCGFAFASEQLRTDRLQVNYLRRGHPIVSNEVVSYVPGGAQQAMRELHRAVAHCPSTPVRSAVQGFGPIRERLRMIPGPHLEPGSVAMTVRYSGRVNQRPVRETVVTVYQRRGDLLSGVYTSGGPIGAQVRTALHAARESAAILDRRAAQR